MRFLFYVLFLISTSVVGQTKISGTVTDKTKKPIINSSVLIENNSEILGFGLTDEKGLFKIEFESEVNNIDIKVTNIAFREIKETVENKTQVINFECEEEIKELEEVVVKTKPITAKSDTLEYNALKFRTEQDRVLGDLLKKLPGIEVEENGSVKYQGKPINKFYVEGKDLLEGAYGQMVSGLSVDEIASIQVLERHQPVKLFRSKVSSQSAGINVKLFDRTIKTGRIELENGLKPILWNYNLSRIRFSEKSQSLFLLKTNNTAEDIVTEQQIFSFEDGFENIITESNASPLISVNKTAFPSVDLGRYMNNQTLVLSTNTLKTYGDDIENKLNINIIYDKQNYQSSSLQQLNSIYAENTSLNKNITNNQHFGQLKIKNTFINNGSTKFLKNITQFKLNLNQDSSQTNLNEDLFNETLSSPTWQFNNNYKRITLVGKKSLSVFSKLNLENAIQNYRTTSSGSFQFRDYLTKSYLQDYKKREFEANQGASLLLKVFKWDMFTHFENTIKLAKLETNLRGISESDQPIGLANNSNDLSWISSNSIVKTSFIKKLHGSELNIKMPLRWFYAKAEDCTNESKNNIQINNIVVEPEISYVIEPNNKLNNILALNIINDFGSISDIITNPYFSNLSFSQQNGILPQTNSVQFSNSFAYKIIKHGLFLNNQMGYTKNTFNSLLDRQLKQNGIWDNTLINEKNEGKSLYFQNEVSQYLSSLKFKYGISHSYNIDIQRVLVNTQSLSLKNTKSAFKAQLTFNQLKWLMIDSEFLISNFRDNLTNNTQNYATNNTFGIIIKELHYLNFKTTFRQMKNNESVSNNQFLDFQYQYTLPKRKIDLNFTINNILNQKQIVETSINEYGVFTNQNFLRPRQFLLSVKFNLKK